MLQRSPVIVCRFIPNGRCVGCGAINVRVNEKTLTCFPCTGQIVTVEDRRRKMYGTMRQRFLDIGAQLKTKIAEFKKPVQEVTPAWVCAECGQKNSGWSKECGRCEKPIETVKKV